MNENITIFLEKLSKDPEAQAKLAAITDPNEAYAFASSIQGGFTKDEIIEVMSNYNNAMANGATDEDLAKIAGGMEGYEAFILGGLAGAMITVYAAPFL